MTWKIFSLRRIIDDLFDYRWPAMPCLDGSMSESGQ